MQEQILWIAIPNGQITKNGQTYLRISAQLSVRLTPDQPMDQLESFDRMKDWTQLLLDNQDQFRIVFNNDPPREAEADLSFPSASLWKSVFPENTPVKGFEQKDYRQKRIHSYPVRHLQNYLLNQYAQAGLNSPDSPIPTWEIIPLMEELSDYGVPLREVGNILDKIREEPEALQQFVADLSPDRSEHNRLAHTLESKKYVPFKMEDPNIRFHLAQVEDFYAPRPNKKLISPIRQPEWDFHERISALSDYPLLLRKLGLVVEFLTPLPDGLPNTGSVRLQHADWTGDVFPNSRYQLKPAFLPEQSAPKAISENGLLKIGDPELFTLTQMDLEGGSLKMKNTADNLAQGLLLNRGIRRREGLPYVRSTGITLSNNGLAGRLNSRFNINQVLEDLLQQNKPIELTAEHLLAGYRLDIYDEEKGSWFSLYRRNGSYKADGNLLLNTTDEDEGFTQLGVSQSIPDTYDPDDPASQESDDLYAAENQFVWDGWSLSVPRPDEAVPHEEELPPAQDPFIEAEFKVPKGSLPRLRFGKKYRLRIRTVDLAGNSPQTTDDSFDDSFHPKMHYLRYEPIASPAIMRTDNYKDGESMERMVVRSNGPDMEVNQFGGKYVSIEEQASGLSYRHKVKSLRIFLPPEVDFGMAEKHGVFDEGIGNSQALNKVVQQYNLLKNHDHIPPANPNQQYHPQPESEEFIYDEQKPILPNYLPDPAAEGLAIWWGEPRELLIQIPFYPNHKSWPDPRPVHIQLEGHNGPFQLDTSLLQFGKLIIKMPAGEQRTLYISSYTSQAYLEKMALWPHILELLEKGGDPISPEQQKRVDNWRKYFFRAPEPVCKTWTKDELADLILKGGHWMFTPPRPLEIVHAVQQPLEKPEIISLKAIRVAGDSKAFLESSIGNHSYSTGEIDLHAEWEEILDDLTESKPVLNRKKMVVTELAVGYDEQEVIRKFPWASSEHRPIKHLFNDTKRRTVSYQVIATTRYREYFTQLLNTLSDQEFPVIRLSDSCELIIKNSERPATPEVAYILPLLQWEREYENRLHNDQELVEEREHYRRGGLLRIYLKRPWYTSGEGERLGIVCLNPEYAMQKLYESSACDYDNEQVTRWARDPINYQGIFLDRYPTVRDFYDYSEKREGLTLKGEEAGAYDVVGYPVKFDEARGLWYSDVYLRIPEGHYFPFLRFSLARFQPESVARGDEGAFYASDFDYHLSQMIRSEFIQVLPDRHCSYQIKADKPNELKVSMAGPIALYAPGAGKTVPTAGSMVTLHIEEKIGEGDAARYVHDPVETRFFNFINPNALSPVTGPPYNLAFQPEGSGWITLSKKYRNRSYRAILTEWETRLVDGSNPSITGATSNVLPGARIVFSDMIEVEGEGVPEKEVCWHPVGKLKAVAPPTSVIWDFGRVDCLAQGENGSIWRNSFHGNKWGQWTDLGKEAPAGTTVSLLSSAPKQWDLVMRGTGRTLWHYGLQEVYSQGQWVEQATGWHPIRAIVRNEPTLVSWGPERLDLFALGNDLNIWHYRRNRGEWFGWEKVGPARKGGLEGKEKSRVGLAAQMIDAAEQEGRIFLFVRKENNELWFTCGQGKENEDDGKLQWKEWKQLGKGIIADPVAATYGQGVFVFAVKETGVPACNYWTEAEGWSGWTDLPGALAPKDAALQLSPILQSIGYWALDVVMRDRNRLLLRNRWNGEQWSGWEQIFDGPVHSPVNIDGGYEVVHLVHTHLNQQVMHASYLAPLNY